LLKNATAYTWDWYCHLVVDRASLGKDYLLRKEQQVEYLQLKECQLYKLALLERNV
jgi:hypothetical protein